jgi:hypothetical protein
VWCGDTTAQKCETLSIEFNFSFFPTHLFALSFDLLSFIVQPGCYTPPQVPGQAVYLVRMLEIPEITELVTAYLEGQDLVGCIKVSKGWREAFLPYRWQVIRRIHSQALEEYTPITLALTKMPLTTIVTLFATSLSLECSKRPIYYKYHYPNLHHLRFEWSTMNMSLTESTPLLVHLVLDNVTVGPSFCKDFSAQPPHQKIGSARRIHQED